MNEEVIRKILGLKLDKKVCLTPYEMAKTIKVTFFPYDKEKVSNNVIKFAEKIESQIKDIGVEVVPYNESLSHVSFLENLKKVIKITLNNIFFIIYSLFKINKRRGYIPFVSIKSIWKRNRIQKNISIISLGSHPEWKMPVDYTSSLSDNQVISILDWPSEITERSSFDDHFNKAMELFAFNISHVVLATDGNKFILYNFNLAHPVYRLNDREVKGALLWALIPKLAAPIMPPTLRDFKIDNNSFSVVGNNQEEHINDLVNGSKKFSKTNLYPTGKKVDDLPFRNEFYKWIGKLHLDHRSGMSYGFLAKQLPIKLKNPEKINKEPIEKIYKDEDGYYHVYLNIKNEWFDVTVPDVWVLTQRSGSDKTKMDPKSDIIKIGLVKGEKIIQFPKNGFNYKESRPSFDTNVIIAHAVGNGIIANLLLGLDKSSYFCKQAYKGGFSISHWHGYWNKNKVPKGLHMHGMQNPHVSCSSPQSAIYALQGKLQTFIKAYENGEEYKGDIHIEPHHGSNVTFESVTDLADIISEDLEITKLGNQYLIDYTV
ncbi:MAG: hypothetical protein U5L75_02100 [Candidatus Campbellbacteria bacterium]|nr:hypothetical protein [Candidatus Campbellbacteria bacterium]